MATHGAARRLALSMLVGVLLATACSSDDATGEEIFGLGDETTSADQSADGGGGETTEGADSDGGNATVSPAEQDEALAVYADFLATRDLANDGAAESVARLDELVTDEVVVQLDLLDLPSGYRSHANITGLSGDTSGLAVRDCVETVADGAPTRFIDQETTLTLGEAGWRVTELYVYSDGLEGDGLQLGCAPAYHGERAVASVEAMYQALNEDYLDPSEGLSDETLALLDDPLRAAVSAAFEGQAAEGWYRDAPEEYLIEPLGSDLGTGGTAFLVGVCTLMPEGRFARSVGSGEVVESTRLFQPGDVTYTIAMVTSTPDGTGGFVDRIRNFGNLEYPSDCWERAQ